MKTGVLTSGVSGDFEHALAVIREDGFRYVEIQFAWGVEDGSRTPIQEEKIRQLLNRYGMQCTAVMRNLFSGLRLDETSLDSRAYRASLDMLRSTAALARSYGCTLTRINAFDRHAVLFGDGGAEKHLTAGNKSWARYLRLMEPVCQIAEDEGIDIMIETGTGSLLHTAALMRRAAACTHSGIRQTACIRASGPIRMVMRSCGAGSLKSISRISASGGSWRA